MNRAWARFRKIWLLSGSLAFCVFMLWSLLAFRANPDARAALRSNGAVSVRFVAGAWHFSPIPAPAADAPAVLFFPGGLVEPAAYAPLLQGVARRGYTAVLVPLPWRGAFGAADGTQVFERARAAMRLHPASRWIVAGHSKGGAVAARMFRQKGRGLQGLVLIGTSHPRDFSLSDARVPIVQILGSRDPIASIARADRNRDRLPAQAQRVIVTGGNHSQFGEYGFQPGDRFATLTRQRQRELTLSALLNVLSLSASAAASGDVSAEAHQDE